jgi:hypothetical protein
VKVYEDYRVVVNMDTGKVIASPAFVHVVFSNKQALWSMTACRVHARILFYNEENRLLFEMAGRWGETRQPAAFETTRGLEIVDIDANEKPIEVNVAMKYTWETDCYAFNNESYQVNGFKLSKFRLSGKRFRVCIQLVGVNFRKQWWFELLNEGENRDMQLTRCPPVLNVPYEAPRSRVPS